MKDKIKWKNVIGFEGLYRISSNGEVISIGRKEYNGRNGMRRKVSSRR